jgi:hypothetical protein
LVLKKLPDTFNINKNGSFKVGVFQEKVRKKSSKKSSKKSLKKSLLKKFENITNCWRGGEGRGGEGREGGREGGELSFQCLRPSTSWDATGCPRRSQFNR